MRSKEGNLPFIMRMSIKFAFRNNVVLLLLLLVAAAVG